MLLRDEEKVEAIKFICSLAETFSSCELLTVDSSKVHQDCVQYSQRMGSMLCLFRGIILQTFLQFLGGTVIVPTKN